MQSTIKYASNLKQDKQNFIHRTYKKITYAERISDGRTKANSCLMLPRLLDPLFKKKNYVQSQKDVRKEQLFKANFFLEDDGNGLVFSGIDKKNPPGKSLAKVAKDMNYDLICVEKK